MKKQRYRTRETGEGAVRQMAKRGLALLLTLVLAAGMLSGCAKQSRQGKATIFTGDEDALRVFVRSGATYADVLQEKFPDIKFDFYHYGGLNTSMLMNKLIEEDDFGDICITSLQLTDEVAAEHLIDLSGEAVCSRYEPSVLSQFDVGGDIYQLPGYITMRNMIYNRDMFAEHGWQEPKNFTELVALCAQIREETDGITPIVMGGAAEGYYFTTMTTYAQSEFLYTQDGQKWAKEWKKGTAGAEEGFGRGIEMTNELIAVKAFDYEKNDGLWDTEIFEKRMLTGEAAMMYAWGGQKVIAELMEENPKVHFGIMPFRNRDGQAFIGTNIPYYIGLSKNLEKDGNEKKLKDAMRVLEYLSTEEGISVLSTEVAAAIYPLKDAGNVEAVGLYRDFWNENLDSIKAPMLYAGYEDILVPAAQYIIEAVQHESSLDGLADFIDETHTTYLTEGAEAIEVGSIAADFTPEETVQAFADILYAEGDSDIALVTAGDYRNGVLNVGGVFGRFCVGSVLEDQASCCLPGVAVNAPAVQMTLTGKEIRDLLENGKHGLLYEGHTNPVWQLAPDETAVAEAAFDYYWAGMNVKLKNGVVKSIKLSDGRKMSDEKTYTVTFAGGDYMAETEAAGSLLELPYTTRDAFMHYLAQNSPLTPPERHADR